MTGQFGVQASGAPFAARYEMISIPPTIAKPLRGFVVWISPILTRLRRESPLTLLDSRRPR